MRSFVVDAGIVERTSCLHVTLRSFRQKCFCNVNDAQSRLNGHFDKSIPAARCSSSVRTSQMRRCKDGGRSVSDCLTPPTPPFWSLCYGLERALYCGYWSSVSRTWGPVLIVMAIDRSINDLQPATWLHRSIISHQAVRTLVALVTKRRRHDVCSSYFQLSQIDGTKENDTNRCASHFDDPSQPQTALHRSKARECTVSRNHITCFVQRACASTHACVD
ncbi:hypothetical protein F5I97DRAFT_264894 [Phlebopus sp. FC_14]|nr:hypothetical protein F5I97DRAFT_264894 [Phlebopus sp. FC_14]